MSRFRTMVAAAAAGLVALAGPALAGDNWSNWRGPNYNGSTTGDPPVEFSQTENVKWKLELPGPSAATPIVHGSHVFVSSADPETEKLWAIAVDRESGEILWQHEAGAGYEQDNRSNYASPSPVTDGERVIFFYGTGDLVAYDFDGEELWRRNIQADYGEFSFLWTFSTSPALVDGTLYMQVLQRDEPVRGRGRQGADSYILALDPETGEELWRHVRPSDAVAESREAFTTPVPHEYEGRKELIVVGGDAITGHDLETGEELWRWGTWNPRRIGHWRLVPSAVAGGGVILASAPKGEPIFAVKAGGEGDLDDSSIAWQSDPRGPLSTDVPTPAYHDGHFYVIRDEGPPRRHAISKAEAETGEIVWSETIPGAAKSWASPTVVGGRVYFQNLTGDVFIYDAENGELINQIPMADDQNEIRSTISVAGDDLFIRNNRHLYRIGE